MILDYGPSPQDERIAALEADLARQRRTIERLAGLCVVRYDGVYYHPGCIRDQCCATEAEAVAAVIAWAEGEGE